MSHSDHNKYPLTDTNMMVDQLANTDKLISEHKRWKYQEGDSNPELDDNHENYVSDKKHSDHHDHHHSDHHSDHRSDHHHSDKHSDHGSQHDNGEHLDRRELLGRKMNVFRKLAELAANGVKLSREYTVDSDLEMMEKEYELHTLIRSKKEGVKWMAAATLHLVYGIEVFSKSTYNPVNIDLSGWTQTITKDMNSYYDVFGELYEHYNGVGVAMRPEFKLLMLLSGSALKFGFNKINAADMPTLNSNIDNDPEFAERMRQRALEDNNKKLLEEKASRQHENANQKMRDMSFVKQKEREMLEAKRDTAKKQEEYAKLAEGLSMKPKQQFNIPYTNQYNSQYTNQYNNPNNNMNNNNQQQFNNNNQQHFNSNQRQQFNNNQQHTMKVPPIVQKMMQQQQQQQMNQYYNLNNQPKITKELPTKTENMKTIKEIEEKNSRKMSSSKQSSAQTSSTQSSDSTSKQTSRHMSKHTSCSSTSSDSVKTDLDPSVKNIVKSSNKKLNKNTTDSESNLDIMSSSDKIKSHGIIVNDEFDDTKTNLSLKKRRKKKNEQNDANSNGSSKTSRKSRTIKQKTTGITLS